MDPVRSIAGAISNLFNQNSDNPIAAQTESTSLVAKKICSFCHRENPRAKMCGRCKLVNFCNKECQGSAWATHKLICKEPIETTLTIETGNFGEEKKTRELPFRIHNPEDVKQTGARPTGFAAIKKKNLEGLEGKSIKLSLENVVSFAGRYSLGCISRLRVEGYTGLKSVDQKQLDELLKDEQYIEILKHVWTEEDHNFKVNWLRERAGMGHVILMFETGRALSETKNMKEDILLETWKWCVLGKIHTYIDIACYDDESVIAAAAELRMYYFPAYLLESYSAEYKQELIKKIDNMNQMILEIELRDTDPSPGWLMNFGMKSFMGVSGLRPQGQWLESRSKRREEMTAML